MERPTSWDFPTGARSVPLIIAHRGDVSNAPENTLPAFRSACEHGADGVELDVRMTRDRQLVVTRDRQLSRPRVEAHHRQAGIGEQHYSG